MEDTFTFEIEGKPGNGRYTIRLDELPLIHDKLRNDVKPKNEACIATEELFSDALNDARKRTGVRHRVLGGDMHSPVLAALDLLADGVQLSAGAEALREALREAD